MYTVSPDEIKNADALAVSKYGISELTLMKNAARGCADIICRIASRKDRIVILCGKGNNGGDGYELASIFGKLCLNVAVINVFDCEPTGKTAFSVYKSCKDYGTEIYASDMYDAVIDGASIVIDAIFGTGFSGKVTRNSKIGAIIEKANATNALRIAIDVPSGINCGDGSISEVNFNAFMTITMAYAKTGLFSLPARDYCGEIRVIDIGYPKEMESDISFDGIIPDSSYITGVFPERKKNSHKGDFGQLLTYCGSPFMTGAAILCANAALRSGVGLVNIARDEKTLSVLQNHLTEPIFSPLSADVYERQSEFLKLSQKATACLIGCGMGKDEGDAAVCEHIIKNVKTPIILDADGINAIAANKHILREAAETPVITPHPLEFSRLIGKEVSEIQQNRLSLAREFAKEYGCVVVLKGASTVTASPDGFAAVNTTGSSGLAKGGSGDVLAGLIASFRAQGMSAFDSAASGVFLHGLACDILCRTSSERSVLPSDLITVISSLLP